MSGEEVDPTPSVQAAVREALDLEPKAQEAAPKPEGLITKDPELAAQKLDEMVQAEGGVDQDTLLQQAAWSDHHNLVKELLVEEFSRGERRFAGNEAALNAFNRLDDAAAERVIARLSRRQSESDIGNLKRRILLDDNHVEMVPRGPNGPMEELRFSNLLDRNVNSLFSQYLRRVAGRTLMGQQGMFNARTTGQTSDVLFGSPAMSFIDSASKGIGGGVNSVLDRREMSQAEARALFGLAPFSNLMPAAVGFSHMIKDRPERAPRRDEH